MDSLSRIKQSGRPMGGRFQSFKKEMDDPVTNAFPQAFYR